MTSASEITAAIDRTRELARAGCPRRHAEWPTLRPKLLRAEAWLQGQARREPDDDAAGVRLQEVRCFLGRPTP